MHAVRWLLLIVAGVASAPRLEATDLSPCSSSPSVRPLPSPIEPPAPLGRVVSFHASEISLKEALDRLATTVRVRLTYSADALPLDKRVCVSLDSASVKDVLATLLEDAARPVAAGPDHIVLVPGPGARMRPPVLLERLVVTGSATGAAEKTLSLALSVVDGEQLTQRSVRTLADALNGSVPGLWMWSQSPTSFLGQYGSVRGASSFGLSYPKVYVDGIEVANPLLVTRLNPRSVDRIEVIQGPQGAALYGADAISGVTNIFLRHDGLADGDGRAILRSGLSLAASRFAPSHTLGQEHGVSVRLGSNTRSAGLDADFGTSGAYIPGASAHQINASGTARVVGARTLLTGTMRLVSGEAGTPISPLLPPAPVERAAGTVQRVQNMEQHTVGVNFKVQPINWWIHSLVVGVDGYRLSGVPDERTPIPFATDAALIAARGGANRLMGRWSSVVRVGAGGPASLDLTLLAEQSFLYRWAEPASSSSTTTRQPTMPPPATWRNNSGLGGQLNAALFRQLFLTGGYRFERATNVTEGAHLPMLGAAWVLGQDGPVTLKLRGAYGKGIRWPQTTVRETLLEWTHHPAAVDSLAPEAQSGVEGGFDLLVAGALGIRVTRFDQLAGGLIQRVGVPRDTVLASGEVKRRIIYQLQNVGEIANRGWELQGRIDRGPLAITGTMGVVDSRVQKVARTYTGDLRAGDRMLNVPARTWSLSAAWSAPRWSASLAVARGEDWIYYDRLTLAQRFAATNKSYTGPALREYWLAYPGVTHLRAAVTSDLVYGFALSLVGDNLLDVQTGEPDNVTVRPGRTIALSLSRTFK